MRGSATFVPQGPSLTIIVGDNPAPSTTIGDIVNLGPQDRNPLLLRVVHSDKYNSSIYGHRPTPPYCQDGAGKVPYSAIPGVYDHRFPTVAYAWANDAACSFTDPTGEHVKPSLRQVRELREIAKTNPWKHRELTQILDYLIAALLMEEVYTSRKH